MNKTFYFFTMLIVPMFIGTAAEYYSYENVLGTSFDLYVDADKKEADRCCTLILEEIERLNRCFNTELSNSEIFKLNNKKGKIEISRELFDVLKSAQKYQKASKGAYSVAISPLTNLWQKAVQDKMAPNSQDLKQAIELQIQASSCELWESKNKYYCLKGSGRFNLYSLAKGYIMDKCLQKVKHLNKIQSISLNIGGDILCRSKSTETILDICNPFQHNENDPSMSRIKIKNGALATSGNYARYFEIQGNNYSHIIDGRSGLPVKEIVSASVWTANAVDADALATMANILKPQETLDIINSIDGCECLMVSADGKTWRSDNFSKIELTNNSPVLSKLEASNGAWGAHSVTVNFKLVDSTPKKRFHKHYTLVWVEDSKGKIVRHLAIWMKRKKSKYLKSVRNWWNGGGKKVIQDKKIMTLSRATRPPGTYSLTWNGLDDKGNKCKAGTYSVHIEVSREKGPKKYVHSKVKIACGKKANKQKAKDQPELLDVSVEYK